MAEIFKDAEGSARYMTDELEKAGLAVPEGFFNLGRAAAESFGEGFAAKMEDVAAAVVSVITSSMSGIGTPGGGAAGGGSNISITYQFSSSGETISQQLETARNASEVEKMRGGY